MGNLNAKVGGDDTDRELIMRRHGIGTCNKNGELFTDFCSFNDLVISGTIYPDRKIHKTMSARWDKRQFVYTMTEEAETAAKENNMKRVYEITRTLSGKIFNPSKPFKDKNGKTITSDEEQRRRWVEHFDEILN